MKIDRYRPPQVSEVAAVYERKHERREADKHAAGLGATPAPTGLGNVLAAGLANIFGVRRS